MDAAGGGGYGDPRERDREMLAEDVLQGYVTEEGAARDYGVLNNPEGIPGETLKS
jgi:N-methylhydantoinase B